MILRQLFDLDSFTYTYLVADENNSRQAAIIDPVQNQLDTYLRLIDELELNLIYAMDTHTHADHITALGELRDKTNCHSLVGKQSQATCASNKFEDNQKIPLGELTITALHTPGHTDDSYSFLITDKNQTYLFTGDTLLIRGTGRTDFQNGNAAEQYQSLFNKILLLDETTMIYPGHDYRGQTTSTLKEEKQFNPRLQVNNQEEYSQLMANLNLPNPKLMDIAVPANLQCGKPKDNYLSK